MRTGLLKWVDTTGQPVSVLRMQRLFPNGIPVVILHNTGSPHAWMINLDQRSSSKDESCRIATVRVVGFMRLIDEICPIQLCDPKNWARLERFMNAPISANIGSLIVNGVATIQERREKR